MLYQRQIIKTADCDRNAFHNEKCFPAKSKLKPLVPINPDLTVYKRKVIKRAKLMLKISLISHISFPLCVSKDIKLNIQQIHFRISSHQSEQSIYFDSNKN